MTAPRLLAGLLCALAALLAEEAVSFGTGQGGGAASQVALATKPASPPPPAPTVAEATDTLLARPLFTPGRRGGAEAATGQVPGLARLSGTILAPQGRYAVMEPDGERHPLVIGVGGVVDGWTVQWIGDGSIRVARDGAVRTILARFKLSADPAPLEVSAKSGLLATKRTDPHLQP